jgi:hypothetical protein
LQHIVLRSAVPLTVGGEELYEWSDGKLTSIGIGASGDDFQESARGAISEDGSRVFFEGKAEGLEGLLMREVPGTTVKLDTPESEPGCPAADECGAGSVKPAFQLASGDGSRVLFTDTQKLTANAGEAGDLYAYDFEKPLGERLTDITPSGVVLGKVLGASEDAYRVYFVADGVLAPGAVHGTCPLGGGGAPSGPSDTCNLYMASYDSGTKSWTTTLITILSGKDAHDWAPGVGGLVGLTARVSPNGEWLAFMSRRPLTGYDNDDAATGKPDEEVYLYSASAGELICASCNPTGVRPAGVEYANATKLFEGDVRWPPGTPMAANVPGWTPYQDVTALYQSRYLSDEGRLFFNSSDALVPKDVNGQQDVYEFEPEGVPAGEHACTSVSHSGGEVFKPERAFKAEVEGVKEEGVEGAGCVGLISSGDSPQESVFLDASESGGDVFFLTTAKLAPQDYDDAYDIYDAQECTNASPCQPAPAQQPPACTTEASCKASPTPQPGIFGAPPSATFNGPGNSPPPPPAVVKPKPTAKCKHGFVRKKVKKKEQCVKAKRQSKKAKKSSKKRGQ